MSKCGTCGCEWSEHSDGQMTECLGQRNFRTTAVAAPVCRRCGREKSGENAISAVRGDGRPFVRCRNCERGRDRVRKSQPGARGAWASLSPGIRNKFRAMIFERDGHQCQVRILPSGECTGQAEQLDHVIGLKDGGALLDPNNARASCGPCNRARNRGAGTPPPRYPAPIERQRPAPGSLPPASREW